MPPAVLVVSPLLVQKLRMLPGAKTLLLSEESELN